MDGNLEIGCEKGRNGRRRREWQRRGCQGMAFFRELRPGIVENFGGSVWLEKWMSESGLRDWRWERETWRI
jgi:hypothetical protein